MKYFKTTFTGQPGGAVSVTCDGANYSVLLGGTKQIDVPVGESRKGTVLRVRSEGVILAKVREGDACSGRGGNSGNGSTSGTSDSGNCTPGYSPCLPPASDYDCSGGEGNGPEFTGPVRVTGSDPYGLDADHNGFGCESS
jgi:hypothetical protein